MSEDIHAKVLAFISGQLARKDHRQCVELILFYAPGGGYKDEEIRRWVRAEQPELFDTLVETEALVRSIVEIAEGEADARPAGKHRFMLRSAQHLGGREQCSFAIQPAYSGEDSTALSISGGGRVDAATVLAQNNAQLMRVNSSMYDGTVRVLAATNQTLREENTELRTENLSLRRELEDARSSRLEREFAIAQAKERGQIRAFGMQKFAQIADIAVAKMTGAGVKAPSTLVQLLGSFFDSLRDDQTAALFQMLDNVQKAKLGEIVNAVQADMSKNAPPDPEAEAKPANGANGVAHP